MIGLVNVIKETLQIIDLHSIKNKITKTHCKSSLFLL